MSLSKQIEPPYILASLPHPVDSIHGRTLASGVHSLHRFKRRKRFECAVSVDGEGISIYNVQNPRLIASYAVPPHTYFSHPPRSLYQKLDSGRPARRHTYASIVSSQPADSKAQVICFREEVQTSSVGDAERLAYSVAPQHGEIATIETVCSSTRDGDTGFNVVVVYRDGAIECRSSDLQTQKWTSNLERLLPPDASAKTRNTLQVEYASVTSGDALRRMFMKDRDDIVEKFDSLKSESSHLSMAPILCLVTSNTQNAPQDLPTRYLHMLVLPTDHAAAAAPASVLHLSTWQLPNPSNFKYDRAGLNNQYYLHPATATLQQLNDDAIICYRLSHASPEMSVFQLGGGSFKSFIRISASLSLTVSSGLLGLYDVRYSALQGSLHFQAIEDSHTDSKKRKRNSMVDDTVDLSLICNFSELGLVLGLAGHNLVAIQLGDKYISKKRQRSAGLLIDSISKGVSSFTPSFERSSVANSLRPFSHLVTSGTQLESEWDTKVGLLNQYAERKDISNFERVFTETLRVGRNDACPGTPAQSHSNVTQYGPMDTTNIRAADTTEIESNLLLPSWESLLALDESDRLLNRPRALYALSKIFEWSSDAKPYTSTAKPNSSISIKFLPPNVFQWLLLSGFLSKDLIERALHQPSSISQQSQSVKEGDVITSVFNFDKNMRLLYFMLNSRVYLDIHEVVQAIALIIRSLEATPLANLTSRLFTKDSVDIAQHDTDTAAYLDEAVNETADAIEEALETLENGVLLRGQTLRPALTKLHSFPAPRIVESLKEMLDHRELIALMQLLRVELSKGGWASRYFVDSDLAQSSETEDPSDRAIGIIATLLSCVLDAIGISGWLTAASSSSLGEEAPDDLISLLRQEISAALEGVHEATFMKGLLGEYLRFCHRDANSVKIPDHIRNRLLEKPFLVPKQDSEYETLQKRIVPLGLRPVMIAQEMWKKTIGGQSKARSRREMGQAISRQVPKYSIEKIRF